MAATQRAIVSLSPRVRPRPWWTGFPNGLVMSGQQMDREEGDPHIGRRFDETGGRVAIFGDFAVHVSEAEEQTVDDDEPDEGQDEDGDHVEQRFGERFLPGGER